MKCSLKVVLAILMFGTLTACGHIHKVEGEHPEVKLPAGVRVGIGGKEVKAGDIVKVLESKCREVNRGRAGKFKECTYKQIGSAKVLEVLDHDSAIVEPQDGLVMNEKMRVEK